MKPNLVLILVDDMGYGDFSCINGGLSQTPTLDQLINESVVFSHQYTASPVCNPSRASLLTGRYPHRTGSIDTLEWRGLDRLSLREITLANILKSAGYVTGLIGKWHLGAFDMRYHPMNRGFDETICFRGGMHDYYSWRLEYNEKVVFSDGRYLTDVFTEESINFIKRHKNEPFFLHITYNAPHTPLQAPDEDVKPFLVSGKFTRGVSILYGMIKRMDKGVAKILETLNECGLERNTIVMFSSDNGPQFGGSGEMCLNRFNCYFHGAKGSVYEGGIRVSMIIRWSDGIENKKEIKEMVHFCDWFPTILSLLKIPIPKNLKLDGIDVSPLLRGEKITYPKRFWQWNRYTPLVISNAAVRDGDWKLVRPAIKETMEAPCCNPWLRISMYAPEYFIKFGLLEEPEPERNIKSIPEPELYNIAEDPLEKNNLANKYPDKVSKLLHELETWFEDVENERKAIDDIW